MYRWTASQVESLSQRERHHDDNTDCTLNIVSGEPEGWGSNKMSAVIKCMLGTLSPTAIFTT